MQELGLLWSYLLEYLNKLVSYIKFYGGNFNVHSCVIREVLCRLPGMNILSSLVRFHDVSYLNELSDNGLYDPSANGLNVLPINVHPRDIHGLHKLFVNCMNSLSIHICPSDVRESWKTTPESGLNGMNVFNGVNVLMLESAQEHTLSQTEF